MVRLALPALATLVVACTSTRPTLAPAAAPGAEPNVSPSGAASAPGAWRYPIGSRSWVMDLAALPDGGAVLVGQAEVAGAAARQVWLLRVGADGEVRWLRDMHAGGHTAERVTVSSQGAVAWCGGAALGGRLVVTDAQGVVTADHTTPEHVAGIAFDARGVLYATMGEAVVAYGPSGSERWRRDLRAGDGEGRLDAIAVAPDGDLVVIGNAHGEDGRWSLRILRLAPNGAPRWDKGLPGELAGASADALALAADGDIIIGGERDTSSYAWVARLDAQGEPRWSHLFGGAEGIHRTRRVAVGPHGVIVAGGRSRPSDGELDSWVAHVDASGASWQRWLEAPHGGQINGLGVTPGGAVVLGVIWQDRGGAEALVGRFDPGDPDALHRAPPRRVSVPSLAR